MKRLLISFFILCLFIFYSYFSEKFVLNFCSEVDGILEACATEIKEEKYSQAKSTASKLLSKWEDNHVILGVFIGDANITYPQKDIISLYHCLEDENYTYGLIIVRECQGYLKEIAEENRTSLGNIL